MQQQPKYPKNQPFFLTSVRKYSQLKQKYLRYFMKLQQIYLHPYCQPDIKHVSQLKIEPLLPLKEP